MGVDVAGAWLASLGHAREISPGRPGLKSPSCEQSKDILHRALHYSSQSPSRLALAPTEPVTHPNARPERRSFDRSIYGLLEINAPNCDLFEGTRVRVRGAEGGGPAWLYGASTSSTALMHSEWHLSVLRDAISRERRPPLASPSNSHGGRAYTAWRNK